MQLNADTFANLMELTRLCDLGFYFHPTSWSYMTT